MPQFRATCTWHIWHSLTSLLKCHHIKAFLLRSSCVALVPQVTVSSPWLPQRLRKEPFRPLTSRILTDVKSSSRSQNPLIRKTRRKRRGGPKEDPAGEAARLFPVKSQRPKQTANLQRNSLLLLLALTKPPSPRKRKRSLPYVIFILSINL